MSINCGELYTSICFLFRDTILEVIKIGTSKCNIYNYAWKLACFNVIHNNYSCVIYLLWSSIYMQNIILLFISDTILQGMRLQLNDCYGNRVMGCLVLLPIFHWSHKSHNYNCSTWLQRDRWYLDGHMYLSKL